MHCLRVVQRRVDRRAGRYCDAAQSGCLLTFLHIDLRLLLIDVTHCLQKLLPSLTVIFYHCDQALEHRSVQTQEAAMMRRASSHSMTPPAPSFRKRLWIGVGLLFTLALVNELAAGQKVWLWGAGLLVGALIGLFIAVRNSNPSNHPAIETLGWIVAAALGIAIVVALPKHVLYTLLKIAIIALLWSGRRRDRCDHHHSQPD
jgi:hypothetical protein